MSEYIIQHDTMVGIADAVRTMTGTADKLSPDQIVAKAQEKAATMHTVYIGTTEPTTDIGNDGDIYIVRTVSA